MTPTEKKIYDFLLKHNNTISVTTLNFMISNGRLSNEFSINYAKHFSDKYDIPVYIKEIKK